MEVTDADDVWVRLIDYADGGMVDGILYGRYHWVRCVRSKCKENPDCKAGQSCISGVCAPSPNFPEEGCTNYVAPSGRWTDPSTGLIWENPPDSLGGEWGDAIRYCQDLELDGGNWRLPTIDELRTLINGCNSTEIGGECEVSEGECLSADCERPQCDGCEMGDSPVYRAYWKEELLGKPSGYWSSSFVGSAEHNAWLVVYYTGKVSPALTE